MEIRKTAIEAYEQGFRAYLYEDGKHYYKHQETGMEHKVYGTMDAWHALRAYQDEQRKKGEPIIGESIPSGWFESTYRTNDDTEFKFGWSTKNWKPDVPRINVHYRYYKGGLDPVATFTNFRWRPGHGPIKTQVPKSRNPPPPPEPKGGDHAHDINVASIQKGGSQCP